MISTILPCAFSHSAWLTILAGVGFFLGVTILLVVILLVAKRYLVQSGDVTVTMNKDRQLVVPSGKPLLSTMADNNVFLPSAC